MQSMSFDSATADIAAQITDNAFDGLQAAAAAANALTSLPPAGGEEVSEQAVLAFADDAAQLVALNRAAQQELIRVGAVIADIARMYAEVDEAAAGSVLDIGLRWGSQLAGV